MKLKLSTAACTIFWVAASPAAAQSPAISSVWSKTKLSQSECTTSAKRAMDSKGYTRVETIGQTTFGDRGDYQIGIRCITEESIFYVFGGGPEESVIGRYVIELRDEINR